MNIFVAKLSFNTTSESLEQVVVTTTGTSTASGTADVRSEAGNETVALTESDAWLHGAATIKALPGVDAELTLTLYDKGSASLITFSGTLGADGSVTIADVRTDSGGDCASKTGCESTTDLSKYDVEVLAAEVFANPAGGYDITFDLNGADLYSVAYADVRIDESNTVTTCTKSGGCTTTGTTTSTTSEVGFDDVGSVWEGETTLAHEGDIDVDVTTYDLEGKKVEKASVALGRILHMVEDSFATEHTMLSAGGGGNVVVIRKQIDKSTPVLYRAAVVSDGWTSNTAPTHATLELDGGKTLSIPANSYQRGGSARIDVLPDGRVYYSVDINGRRLPLNGSELLTLSDLASPLCVDGTCVLLAENEQNILDLSVTAYAASSSTLPSSATITIVAFDEDNNVVDDLDDEIVAEELVVPFDPEIAVVFANEVTFRADPLGLDLSGQVSLLGAADKKGKQKTLSKGDFSGGFTRDDGGNLALGGVDKNDVQSKGDILIGGEPIDIEKTDTNGDGFVCAAPALLKFILKGEGTYIATYCP